MNVVCSAEWLSDLIGTISNGELRLLNAAGAQAEGGG